MKTFRISFFMLLACMFFFTFSSFTLATGIEGEWAFEVENAPYGYEKGEIIISKDGEVYKALVAVNSGKMTGEKVKVDGDDVSFDVYVEGMKVTITLNIEGDSFTGKAESYEGTFKLLGKRK